MIAGAAGVILGLLGLYRKTGDGVGYAADCAMRENVSPNGRSESTGTRAVGSRRARRSPHRVFARSGRHLFCPISGARRHRRCRNFARRPRRGLD